MCGAAAGKQTPVVVVRRGILRALAALAGLHARAGYAVWVRGSRGPDGRGWTHEITPWLGAVPLLALLCTDSWVPNWLASTGIGFETTHWFRPRFGLSLEVFGGILVGPPHRAGFDWDGIYHEQRLVTILPDMRLSVGLAF